jgi:hypothetical protein
MMIRFSGQGKLLLSANPASATALLRPYANKDNPHQLMMVIINTGAFFQGLLFFEAASQRSNAAINADLAKNIPGLSRNKSFRSEAFYRI